MVSLVCRLKGSAATGILRFPFLSRCFYGRARLISSSSVDSSSPPPPVLMLPPLSFKAGDTKFKFYNLAENRLEGFRVELPNDNNDDDAVLVGSSHGWLAFFNQSNNHLFLSNPISGRHLKLPPIDTLPNPEVNLRHGRGTVSKVILSCSPDDKEEECRAMVSFGPGDRLAFCLPGRSPTHWTPIGRLFYEKFPVEDEDGGPYSAYGRAYEDFVYCSRRKLFSCITEFVINYEDWTPAFPTELEDWDLREPDSPTPRICYWMRLLEFEGGNCSWLKKNKKLLKMCLHIPYLVYAERSDQLFIVVRFINNVDPHKTVGFCVLKVDYRNRLVDKLRLADDDDSSLDGLALFVGMNHSFAVSSAAELGLKPNSIYFTDAVNTRLTHPSDVRRPYHSRGLDIGIFDYENKTLSPFPYCDQTLSTPVWFTPTPSQ